MRNEFDIASLYKLIFNYRAFPYPAGAINIGVSFANEFSALGSSLEGKTQWGIPYFLPVKLNGIELPFPLISISARSTQPCRCNVL